MVDFKKALDKKEPLRFSVKGDKFKETLLAVDSQRNHVAVVKSFDIKQGLVETVMPGDKEKDLFMDAGNSKELAEGIRNFRERFDKYPIEFFRVPVTHIPEVRDAAYAVLKDTENKLTDERNLMKAYRVTPDSLDMVVIDKKEIPWDQLQHVGIQREDIEQDRPLMHKIMCNLPIEQGFDIKHKSSDKVFFDGEYGLEFRKDPINGDINVNIVPPCARPQYQEKEWLQQLNAGMDVPALQRGETLQRCLRDKDGVWNYACLNAYTNRFHLKPCNEVKVPEWHGRIRISGEAREALQLGQATRLEGCKRFDTEELYSGILQYDMKRNQHVIYEPVYDKPYIPKHVKSQLSEAEIKQLENYETIDGSHVTKVDGKSKYQRFGMDRRTNSMMYLSGKREKQEQKQNQDQGVDPLAMATARIAENAAQKKGQGQTV